MAYLTKNQSDIWPRYGLVIFSLGLPVLAFSAQQIFNHAPVWARAAFLIVLLYGAFQFKDQAIDLQLFLAAPNRSQAIAVYLKQQYAAEPSLKVFCDSPEVRVVSGIPRGQFYDSFRAPKDGDGFVAFLRANGIKFLVIPNKEETSTPSQLFPNLVKENGDLLRVSDR